MRNERSPFSKNGRTLQRVWSRTPNWAVLLLVTLAAGWIPARGDAAETWDARVNDMIVLSGSGTSGLSMIASNCSDPLFYNWDQGSTPNCTHEYTVTAGSDYSITCDAVISHQGGVAVSAADVPAVQLMYKQTSPPGAGVSMVSKKGSLYFLQPASSAPGPGQKFLWLDQPVQAIVHLPGLAAGDYHFGCTVNPGQSAFQEPDLANNTMHFILHVKANPASQYSIPTLIPRVPPIGPSPEKGSRIHPPEPVRPVTLTSPRGWTLHDKLLLPAVQHASVHLADGRTLLWNGNGPTDQNGDYVLRARNGHLLKRFPSNAKLEILKDGELMVIQGAHGRQTTRLGLISAR